MTTIEEWGLHYHGLPDARVINTEEKLRAERCIARAVRHRGILLISGPTGSGKTFAAAQALATYKQAVVYALFDGQANPNEMAREILRNATGCTHKGRREDLRDQCVKTFQRATILVIDEAQHLHRSCMFFLRYLHDRPEADLAIILIGTAEAAIKLDDNSTLASRTRKCPFRPIQLDVLLAAIPNYHPVYRNFSADDIQRVYDCYARGDLRRWADFAILALDICEETGQPADSTLVSDVLAELEPDLFGGGFRSSAARGSDAATLIGEPPPPARQTHLPSSSGSPHRRHPRPAFASHGPAE